MVPLISLHFRESQTGEVIPTVGLHHSPNTQTDAGKYYSEVSTRLLEPIAWKHRTPFVSFSLGRADCGPPSERTGRDVWYVAEHTSLAASQKMIMGCVRITERLGGNYSEGLPEIHGYILAVNPVVGNQPFIQSSSGYPPRTIYKTMIGPVDSLDKETRLGVGEYQTPCLVDLHGRAIRDIETQNPDKVVLPQWKSDIFAVVGLADHHLEEQQKIRGIQTSDFLQGKYSSVLTKGFSLGYQLGSAGVSSNDLSRNPDVVSAVAKIKSEDDTRMFYQGFNRGFSQATEEQRRLR